jgi:3-hydroxymyristoyl/3-hydroxydecanoyl-(acyl carrier protein) dehydratase
MFELMEALAVDATAGVARGRARVPADHPFLADHFPGAPVLPGSLQIELCAQVAGPLAEEVTMLARGLERWSFLGLVRNAAFLEPVPLPAAVIVTATVKREETASVAVAVEVSRDGRPSARAELVMVLREAEPGWDDAIRRYRERLARWKAQP